LTPFLKTITEHYYRSYGDHINTCCFVFPNRRSSLFFKKYLAAVCDKPLFAPDTFAINELFGRLSTLRQADTLGLIFSLYKHYKDITKTAETFDEFYSWGETLLSDFNDIDKYMVDAEQLFSNLFELKSIDNTFDYLTAEQIEAIKRFWKDFEEEKHSGSRDNFLQSWLVLAPLYKTLKADLSHQELAYEGMIYRSVAEQIKEKTLEPLPYKRIVFIGLNALNECEKILMKHYQNLDIADFHWDFQSEFMQDPQNKAGLFIRENSLKFPQHPKLDFKKSATPYFESVSIPSNTGQTKIISELLKSKNISQLEQIENTAVILSDEQLMIPMLHALPEEIEAYNITMGYPLRSTAIYTLFSQLLILQKNVRVVEGKVSFYHKNVISILRHSFIGKHFAKESDTLAAYLTEKNLIYTDHETLGSNTIFKLIFSSVANAGEFPTYLKRIFAACLELYASIDNDDNNTTNDERLEKEFLYHLYITISRFDDLLQHYDVVPGIAILSRLLRKHIDSIAVPFFGEPLKGLQVMGILETRTLDFENLIFLSFNEGVFPKAAPINSFIPHNLRYGFGLPTTEHQDAIFAYLYYRMLKRAKNVWMVYNASNSGMRRGEVSRYFSQLKYIYNQAIVERMQTYQVELTTPLPIVIQKSDQVMKKLQRYLQEGTKSLSASALNNYIDCKLKFYFQKVEDIKEQDELKEDVDNSSFGTIFHSVAEHLYKPYENTTLTKEILYHISKNDHEIDAQITKAFADEHFKTNKRIELKGRHLIVGRIIKKYIKQLINVDMSKAPFIYRKGEQMVEMQFNFNTKEAVSFIGFIDRIDEVDGVTRIIDYKTGSEKKMVFKEMKALVDDDKSRPAAIFLTFFYAWMIARTQGNKVLIPNVYYIRSLFRDFNPNIRENKTAVDNFANYYDDFEKTLQTLIAEIFNPDLSFSQTENQDKCRYCDYKDICLK
jgi:CRISPR/Cas system-associated exonuclease Cas4 (RecB family)